MSRHWSWFPPEVHTDTGWPLLDRVRLPRRSPMSSLLCRPPTSCLHQPELQFPLPVTYPDAGACSAPRRPTTRAPASAPCVGDHSPALRKAGHCRGEARSSQVMGPSSSCVLWSSTPPDTSPPCPLTPGRAVAFDIFWNSRHPGRSWFRGRSPTARTFAYLRIARRVSPTGARLATDSGGLTLSRAGFAPAG